jgi:hypothetical protein
MTKHVSLTPLPRIAGRCSSSTLLVRLMAAGPLLAPAIEELRALPPNAHERTVAERILLQLQSTLGHKPKRTRKEQEFIVAMQKSWEDARAEGRTEGRVEGRLEGRLAGRAEGRAETQANAVLTVLRVRGIAVPEAARKRILAQKDLHQLERWHKKAIVATSLGDVIGDVIDDRARRRSSKTVRLAAHKERSGRRSSRVPAQR